MTLNDWRVSSIVVLAVVGAVYLLKVCHRIASNRQQMRGEDRHRSHGDIYVVPTLISMPGARTVSQRNLYWSNNPLSPLTPLPPAPPPYDPPPSYEDTMGDTGGSI